MAITNLDGLVAGMVAGSRLPYSRASLSNVVGGSEASLWRGTGYPEQGAIPTTAAVCTNATTGALPLATKTAGQDRVLSQVTLSMAAVGHTIYIEDRLMHIGGLNGTLTTAQPAVVSLAANLATGNLLERLGNPNYSQVEWYLEWYAATGSTASTPTVNVTFEDDSTANLNVWVAGATAMPATVAISRRYRINNTSSKNIKAVNSVTLSANTGTAGNFGVTAVRRLSECVCTLASQMEVYDWSILAAPKIFDSACVTFSQMCITTTTGASHGGIRQAIG